MSSTVMIDNARTPAYPQPGGSTAAPLNVRYRIGKIRECGILKGDWLDCGCADGGYTEALTASGATLAYGVDVDPNRIAMANKRPRHNTAYQTYNGHRLPFNDNNFDGVLLNEVLEHVADEQETLREIHRVLRRKGHLVVMSPNRWFPFEGHGMRWLGRDFGFPIPFLPWIPSRLAMKVMTARNYWPHELRSVVERAGFEIVKLDYVLPVLEMYPWLPRVLTNLYQSNLDRIDRSPLRKFGVSTFIVARRRFG
jgi:ubiquinone/menaquinone biosynthesis C-methylase UbiE